MSAFMVHEEHINVMVWACTRFSDGGPVYHHFRPDGTMMKVARGENQTELGQMLVDANAASIQARYGDGEATTYRYANPKETKWEAIDVLKAITCFEYQACEVEKWEATEAYSFCQNLKAQLLHSLPRYDDAPWSIYPDTIPAHMKDLAYAG